MTGAALHSARRALGLTQKRAARKLGVTQAYLSMLERDHRTPPPELAVRLVEAYALSPAWLPLPGGEWKPPGLSSKATGEGLGRLGYPGLGPAGKAVVQNPAEVLLTALAQDDLEREVVQALPWLLLRYPEVDAAWLLDRAKRFDLQNRLGFMVSLAREVHEARGEPAPANLVELEAALERSRLVRFGTLCQASMPEEEGRYLYENRSDTARRWNLLTSLRLEALPYGSGS